MCKIALAREEERNARKTFDEFREDVDGSEGGLRAHLRPVQLGRSSTKLVGSTARESRKGVRVRNRGDTMNVSDRGIMRARHKDASLAPRAV